MLPSHLFTSFLHLSFATLPHKCGKVSGFIYSFLLPITVSPLPAVTFSQWTEKKHKMNKAEGLSGIPALQRLPVRRKDGEKVLCHSAALLQLNSLTGEFSWNFEHSSDDRKFQKSITTQQIGQKITTETTKGEIHNRWTALIATTFKFLSFLMNLTLISYSIWFRHYQQQN